MPIYEYRCEPCDHAFETLVRTPADVPHCPKCGGIDHLAKQFSVPAAPQGGGAASSLPICGPAGPPMGGGCGGGACRSGLCGLD